MKSNRLAICISIISCPLIFWGILFYNSIFAATDATINASVRISVCGNGVRDSGEHCDNSDLGGKTCANLGFSGGTLLCSASCEFNITSCTTGANINIAPSFTAASGGEYTLTDSNNSAKIVLPENFYSDDLQLQMFSYDKSVFESSKPPPSGKNFIGKTYDFVFINPEGGSISTLSQPAALTLTYTTNDISGIDESTLAPYRRGSSDSSWQLISGATIDTANKKVTFTTALFSSFALFGAPNPTPTPTPIPTSEQSSGGGGGGGGGYFAPSETRVIFSGRAYPKSEVTLLKDAQIVATTEADSNANFQITLSGLSSGNFIFSIYSEDSKGNRSSLLTFPISVSSGVTVQTGGIFIVPTVAVDKEKVRSGENIAIFGQSAPKADITVAISSEEEFFGKTVADANGAFLYNFDTSQLDMGQHFVKSKAALGGSISSFSKVVTFTVGDKTVFAKPAAVSVKGDLNGDKRVSIVDFSIAAYWYKRTNPPASADLNGDRKIDLIDFSIMAFYWTG